MTQRSSLVRVREALRREAGPSLPAPEFIRHTPEERRALVASLFGEAGRTERSGTD
jgi:hypothetical protein